MSHLLVFIYLELPFPSPTLPRTIKDDNKIYPSHKAYSLAVLLVLCTLTTGTPGPVLRREEKQRKSVG